MKRRQFFTSSLGIYAGIEAMMGREASAQQHMSQEKNFLDDTPAQLLTAYENNYLSVSIYTNGYIEIIDRINNMSWNTWPVALQEKGQVEEGHVWMRTSRSLTEQYPGRFKGELEGNRILFTLIGRQNKTIGRFICHIQLEGPWLVYKIQVIDDSISSLVFPPPVQSDAIIIPRGVGEIIRDTEERFIYSRTIYPFYTRLNMRWIGGQKGDGAWIGIFDEGFEDSYGFFANRTATPIWIRTLGQWRHPYTYRMKFIKGNYVQLAKEYRQWFMDKGYFVSLQDKMKANPRLDSFLGGRAIWISLAFPPVRDKTAEELYLTEDQKNRRGTDPVQVLFTYKELTRMISQLKKLGLEKGYIKIAGWINGGYDNSHQDIWPPEPSLGSVSELKELLAMDSPLISGLHDNNQDMYAHTKSFPKGVVRNPDGELLTGGIWAGGQAYILHSDASIRYARRNWDHIKTLEPKAMFVDIITAMQLYQSFEKGNKLTKHDDIQAKRELMEFYKDQRILLGSEESADFGIPYLDWYENRHRRVQGESIPLWPLVFHDAAFNTRYGGVSRNEGYPGWLEDMLWGYLPHFFISPDWDQEELFRSIDHVDEWHKRIGMAEMTDHQFLTGDFTVERTVFSTGDSITVNFGDQSVEVEDRNIPPGSYLTGR